MWQRIGTRQRSSGCAWKSRSNDTGEEEFGFDRRRGGEAGCGRKTTVIVGECMRGQRVVLVCFTVLVLILLQPLQQLCAAAIAVA